MIERHKISNQFAIFLVEHLSYSDFFLVVATDASAANFFDIVLIVKYIKAWTTKMTKNATKES